MNRKKVLFIVILLVVGFTGLHWANASAECSDIANAGKALSLRALQEAVKSNPSGRPLPPNVANLGGITELCGYLVDSAGRDIIMFGHADPSAPKLHLDDFAVALRNAFKKYTRVEGNTIYYSYPGCSIDPDPEVMRKLDAVSGRINSSQSTEEIESLLQEWVRTCSRPQSVRVMGIPFDSRFARVMIEADYHMKTVVDGSDTTLHVDGLRSLADMTLDSVKAAIEEHRPVSIPVSTMNRFWFYPGEVTSWADQLGVIITSCPVTLLTEQEHLSRRGGMHGSGGADPMALEFCNSFSELYAQVAQQRPIYAELRSLFRFVAVTKTLYDRGDLEAVGLTLDYLLDGYAVPITEVERELEGRSNVKNFDYREDYDGGWSEVSWWFPTCGGVTIAIGTSQIATMEGPEIGDRMRNLLQRIREARPGGLHLEWRYPLEDKIEFDDTEGEKTEFGAATEETNQYRLWYTR